MIIFIYKVELLIDLHFDINLIKVNYLSYKVSTKIFENLCIDIMLHLLNIDFIKYFK